MPRRVPTPFPRSLQPAWAPETAVVAAVYTSDRFGVGEVAESAEGSRLLSGYRVKSSVQGSNPCLSATGP
jgi:hypothetical protein